MKIIIWIALQFYFGWCKIYRFIQRENKKVIYEILKKTAIAKAKEIFKTDMFVETTVEALQDNWNKLLNHWDFKWSKDTWYMLWDVIADPYISLTNCDIPNPQVDGIIINGTVYKTEQNKFVGGGGDCDDHAAIALALMPDNIIINGVYYYKQGFISLITNKPHKGSHAIAYWTTKEESGYLIVSNDSVHLFESKKAIFNWWNDVLHREYKAQGTDDLVDFNPPRVAYLIEFYPELYTKKITSRAEILKDE